MVVTLFLALAAMVVVYGWLGQGGGVAGLIFFGILLIGAVISAYAPKPSPDSSARR
jgi:prepilin signal peptidase PulO-like enzyme (type II secretory pathway)